MALATYRKKLFIVLVVNTFPSISETFIFRKAVALAQHGHKIHVIAGQAGSWQNIEHYLPLPSKLTVEYPFRTKLFPFPLFLILCKQLFRVLVQAPGKLLVLLKVAFQQSSTWTDFIRNFIYHLPFIALSSDVVHCEFLGIAAAYPLLRKTLNIPVMLSCRGADLHLLDQQHSKKREQYIYQLQQVDAVHCVTDEMAVEVKRLSKRSEGIWVNRPAIDIRHITPKTQYSDNTSVPHIVSVGRLVWKKGYDYLFNALYLLKERGLKFQVHIIGDGDLKNKLQSTIHELELTSMVTLMGSVSPYNVLTRLQSADIFALFSHEEGISNAVLEAMATGLPIVTTNAGGMTEAVRDGIDGYVVPVRDIASFADRLALLIADSTIRECMGRSARERVEADFTIERQISVFEQIYYHLVEKESN
jgi:colanic acid/amylovoran biosynthesis glycosyltransferase